MKHKRTVTGAAMLKRFLLNEDDMMTMLGVSIRTLKRLRDENKLPFIQFRSRYYYPPKALQKLIEEELLKTKPPKPPTT